MRKLMLAATLSTFAAAPVHAAIVFSDDFDGEGPTTLNYDSFANFNSTGGGFVDLISSGGYGISCVGGVGGCVDLDGTPGPGQLTSKASFGFNAGDTIVLSMDVSGNQRGFPVDTFQAGFRFGGTTEVSSIGFNNGAGDEILLPSLIDEGFLFSFPDIASSDPYIRRSLFFTAEEAGALTFNVGALGADNVGPIIDNISLDISGDGGGTDPDPDPVPVPEPSNLALIPLGLAALGLRRRRMGRR